jgi:pimeloyl-ACP methyl ester carboxylesterase
VDIGGRRLHLVCLGEGEPTVLFESSMFGGARSSEAARREIGTQTRVCSYDRMGMGWSDPGPAVISAGALADDLERLLDRAGLHPPYILVPSSVGGLTSELFARRHPDRVAGLVFLDAAQSGALDQIVARFGAVTRLAATLAACVPRHAARFGVLRLADPMRLGREPEGARTMAALYRTEPMATGCGLMRGLPTTLRELREAPALRADLPLVVLTAETTEKLGPLGFDSFADVLGSDRVVAQQQFARRSTQGSWQLVPGSDHLIGNSQPHVVASAVLDMVARVRRGAR